MANNPYFFRDVKSSEYEDYQAWNLSGEIYGDSETIVELSWNFSDIDDEINLVMENETINMKDSQSIEVSQLDNITIVIGDINMFNNPVPEKFALGNAYPNPFNPTTQLKLDIAESGYVTAKVYNVMGQVVMELANGHMDAGYHMFTWNAENVSSGMYLIRVQSDANVMTQKVMLLK